MEDARLIEAAFPLRQTSLDSAHEKNVRHGHISTLHIWPARRPLAACRAAILATLLPDPGDGKAREKLCQAIGGRVVQSQDADGRTGEKTEGGVLRWPGAMPKDGGRKKEEYRQNMACRQKQLAAFRDAILKANGGKPPQVYDPFAGGGAIPLEAMRLGCEAHANDLNPVSVFLLGATLKYPQAIGAEKLPIPEFLRNDPQFRKEFFAAHPQAGTSRELLPGNDPWLADLAWHVRAFGHWVLGEARKKLAKRYPAYAAWAPLNPAARFEPRPERRVPPNDAGLPDIDALNANFGKDYLANPDNPRWQLRPVAAYLWARTAICSNPQCRKTIPLLKTGWLCRAANGKRRALKCVPLGDGVRFEVLDNAALARDGKPAKDQERELGQGFMSRSGALCPHCGNIVTMDELKRQGKAGQLGRIPTAVVFEESSGKEYRPWRPEEMETAKIDESELSALFDQIPFGLPEENIVEDAKRNTWCVQYGIKKFKNLFSPRQLYALGHLLLAARAALDLLEKRGASLGYGRNWREAIGTYLAILFDKICDYSSALCSWHNSGEKIRDTFARFALPMVWDYAECVWLNPVGGSFLAQLEWICRYVELACQSLAESPAPVISCQSATRLPDQKFDLIITDPPYYDAIGYSVLMDFFYVWLKRVICGTFLDSGLFAGELAPKWDAEKRDGELIDDASRHNGDKQASRKAYEDGMALVFQRCRQSLAENGRFVVVFAHKNPAAWETLVSAIIRAGFMVTASWPIQTEMGNRMRGLASAALSSSVWLVCKKRRENARPGWDHEVLASMRQAIDQKLRQFWDAGIRGPDFVWAATGPALTVYSSHPLVKKTAAQGESMGVNEFLAHVRKMVVTFVVARLLGDEAREAAERMDGLTAYYLLHRNDFGMEEAPAGACILYATACGLTDRQLESIHHILTRKSEDGKADSGRMSLTPWFRRTQPGLGLEAPGGGEPPLIDRAHKLMWLWKGGDPQKVDSYIDSGLLRSNELFKQLLQALTELSANSERSLLESISNHLYGKGSRKPGMISGNLGDYDA